MSDGPRVFVDDLDEPVLEPDDRHHLERVLRLRPGEELGVGDGAGRWRRCRFGPTVEPLGEIEHVDRGAPSLTICFALVKGERPEWAVQKLTEVGVDRIVPFVAARGVVRWDGAKAARQAVRLRRVARAAAMQSRRAWLPEVADVATFAQVSTLPGAVLASPGGSPPSLEHPTVLVGPEGGWAAEEIGAGLPNMSLSPHILRSETAAVAAGTLLAALRAGLVVDHTK
ncbi:MAG: RsmE family RNA methyltransferase [Actinomycetota bacterium]